MSCSVSSRPGEGAYISVLHLTGQMLKSFFGSQKTHSGPRSAGGVMSPMSSNFLKQDVLTYTDFKLQLRSVTGMIDILRSQKICVDKVPTLSHSASMRLARD